MASQWLTDCCQDRKWLTEDEYEITAAAEDAPDLTQEETGLQAPMITFESPNGSVKTLPPIVVTDQNTTDDKRHAVYMDDTSALSPGSPASPSSPSEFNTAKRKRVLATTESNEKLMQSPSHKREKLEDHATADTETDADTGSPVKADKDLVKMQYQTAEMIQKEQQYLKDIFLLKYIEDKLTADPAFDEYHRKKLFGNLDLVIDVTNILKGKMDDLKDESNLAVTQVSQVYEGTYPLMKLSTHSQSSQEVGLVVHMCATYEKYIAAHSDATQLVEEIMSAKGKKSMKKIIMACEAEAQCRRQKLKDILTLPVQHIMRYLLHLKGMHATAPANHPDKAGLQAVVEEFEKGTAHLNKKAGNHHEKREDAAQAAGNLQSLGFLLEIRGGQAFMKAGRKLVDEQKCKRICLDGTKNTTKTKLILMDDIIMITERTSSHKLKGTLARNLNLKKAEKKMQIGKLCDFSLEDYSLERVVNSGNLGKGHFFRIVRCTSLTGHPLGDFGDSGDSCQTAGNLSVPGTPAADTPESYVDKYIFNVTDAKDLDRVLDNCQRARQEKGWPEHFEVNTNQNCILGEHGDDVIVEEERRESTVNSLIKKAFKKIKRTASNVHLGTPSKRRSSIRNSFKGQENNNSAQKKLARSHSTLSRTSIIRSSMRGSRRSRYQKGKQSASSEAILCPTEVEE